MKVVKAKLKFHWGFISRWPAYTAAQPSTLYLTPTSLLGALAYGLAKLKGLPEVVRVEVGRGSRRRRGRRAKVPVHFYSSAVRALEYCSWVTYRVESELEPNLGLVETMDLSKVSLVLGVRRGNIYPGSPYLWGVQPHGKVYSPSLEVTVAYFAARDDVTSDVERAAWLITRVGSRESVVSVQDVRVVGARPASAEEVETAYAFPSSLAERVDGPHAVASLFVPSREWYNLMVVRDVSKHAADFVIPLRPVRVRPSPASLIAADEDGEAYVLPGGAGVG